MHLGEDLGGEGFLAVGVSSGLGYTAMHEPCSEKDVTGVPGGRPILASLSDCMNPRPVPAEPVAPFIPLQSAG